MSNQKYSERDAKHIEQFGHPLPEKGGSYEWKDGVLKPIPNPVLNLSKQPGFVAQPTTVTAEDVANEHKVATAPAVAPVVK